MKNLILAMILLSAPTLWANTSSSGTRGGGNMEVADFYAKAQGILQALLPQTPVEIASTKLDIKGLIKKLSATKVEAVTRNLTIGEASVDAINYPDKNLIQFNKSRWLKMTDAEKSQLAIHELLGVSRIPDPNYKTSQAIIEYIGNEGENAHASEPCEETRTFSGDKAKHLIRALAIANVKSLKLAELNCRVATDNVVGADEPSIQCNPIGEDLATAQVLADALEAVGVWGEGGMSHIGYSAENITCSADSEHDVYKCSLKAYWDWSCAGH